LAAGTERRELEEDGVNISEGASPEIRLRTAVLTPSENRIASVILDGYPESALLTAQAIAEKAGTSPATVSRLATKLGYQDFAEMQADLRRALRAQLSSPSKRLLAQSGPPKRAAALLEQVIELEVSNLRRTLELTDRGKLEEFVELLGRSRHGRVYVAGSKKAGVVARYFTVQLSQLRARVQLLRMDDTLADQLLDLIPGDVVVLFEPRRATKHTVKLIEAVRSNGAVVAVFTDERPPAVLAESDFVFPTTIDGVSMFDSYAGIFALCTAILAAMIGRNPSEARARAEHLEALNLDFDTWLDER
jgi:DNA-binding MurR/RpiR family transcriptional regulator